MPFKSEKQRRFMYAEHPDIAERWSAEGKGYVEGKDKKTPSKKKKGMGGSDPDKSVKR